MSQCHKSQVFYICQSKRAYVPLGCRCTHYDFARLCPAQIDGVVVWIVVDKSAIAVGALE